MERLSESASKQLRRDDLARAEKGFASLLKLARSYDMGGYEADALMGLARVERLRERAVAPRVLNKPGKLTAEEYRHIAREWLQATQDAPSYEGLFGPVVRGIGDVLDGAVDRVRGGARDSEFAEDV